MLSTLINGWFTKKNVGQSMALDVSYGLLAQFMIAGAHGLLASHLWVNQYAGNVLVGTADTCEDFIEKTKLLKGLKLGTKTPYQFEVEVLDTRSLHMHVPLHVCVMHTTWRLLGDQVVEVQICVCRSPIMQWRLFFGVHSQS